MPLWLCPKPVKRVTFSSSMIKETISVQSLMRPSVAQVVNWLKISDRANFGAHSRTGIEFLGSNYNGILQSTLASNCTPISSELSKLVHSKTWHFTLTQPFHRDFWLPVHGLLGSGPGYQWQCYKISNKGTGIKIEIQRLKMQLLFQTPLGSPMFHSMTSWTMLACRNLSTSAAGSRRSASRIVLNWLTLA